MGIYLGLKEMGYMLYTCSDLVDTAGEFLKRLNNFIVQTEVYELLRFSNSSNHLVFVLPLKFLLF